MKREPQRLALLMEDSEMSAVRDYYKDHHSNFDDLHKILDREPGLLAQLPPLRSKALGCCGAVAGKGSELKLAVVDPDGWDKIAKEQSIIQEKLDAISTAVSKIDAVLSEMDKAGVGARDKTVRGIWSVESGRRTPVIDPHTFTNADRLGHRIPQKRDAQFVAWGQAAEAALREAQAIVDGQTTAQIHATTPPVNPLAELAEKAKSLFA
jgi:hypothetical protein